LALVNLLSDPHLPHTTLAVLIVILIGVPVAWRRTDPVAATAVVVAVLLAGAALQRGKFVPYTESLVAFVLAYSCGARAPLRSGLLAVGALMVAIQVSVGFSEFPNVEIAITVLPPLWVGRQLRRRRDLVTALAARTHELEVEQDAFVRLSVRRERARIARELHDIVAHSVSVMVVQAGAAEDLLDRDPQGARPPLLSIQESGRQAVADLSRMLGLLRSEDAALARAPQPGTAQLAELVAQMDKVGLPVSLTTEGTPRDLTPGVELAGFRIVQEALTNTLKHAGPATAAVRLRYADDAVEIEVVDDGRGGRVNGNGHGLIGMRERVTLYGGTLDAGPRPGGGFAVRARLPLEPSS
jgi:signal transduction histidine kinase